MRSRPTWFWTSFFSSIGVNGVLFIASASWLYSQTPIYVPGYARADVMSPIYLDMPQLPPPDTELGDSKGKGDAADASPGDEPMEAPKASQVQSFLSRDPVGPGRIGDPPSMSTQIPGQNGNGDDGPPGMFGVTQQPQAAQPPTPQVATQTPITPPQPPTPQVATEAPITPPPPDQKNLPPSPDFDPSKKTMRESPELGVAVASIAPMAPIAPPPAPPAQPQTSGGGRPGPKTPAADPAPQSDTESDPFTKEGSVKFKRGSTDVQFGRKHKLVRPQLGLGAETDLLQLRQPVTLILALTLDETGKVMSVEILKSSGSRNVDQACKVAAYQWWLEPTKDKSGKAIKDVVPFTIGFS